MTNNTTFPGTLTCPTSSVSNAMTMGTTKTYVVTMTNASGANKYYIDGYLQASLVLHQGQTYIFDLSSSTLSGHPFEFSTTNNGSHGGGSAYSTGITTTGTYADDQTRTFVVSTSTPTTLYYYCTAHSGMGGSVTISPKAELIVSGGAEFIGTGTIKLPSGTTSERPTTGMTGMIRYNTTTGFIETYTAEGWGSIAPPPVITGISPTSVLGADTATQVFTVTGTGFDTGLSIKLVGADGTEYSVFNTTRVSGQSATFKMGASGASGGYDAAQRPFNVKVIGGDTASAVTSTSTDSIALTAPTITGVSPTSFASSAVGSQTITVTGTNFASSMASGNNIQVLGADGSTLYNVDSAAVASATSITFKLAASGASLTTGQLDNRPYKVRVTDAIGITATSTQTIGFNGIAWSSPASGATLTYNNGVSSSQNLVATDDLGGTDVTFSITSGSVAGLSLGSATASPATFSGSATTDGTTNVTFRVTDNESGTTADRTFSVVVGSELYSFTSHTFTNAGAVGRDGPTLTEARNAYSVAWDTNTNFFNITTAERGIQRWTVPKTGNYEIDAYGAMGCYNDSSTIGGISLRSYNLGARVKGTFALTQGNVLKIAVGQNGNMAGVNDRGDGGGGGGTFVWLNDPPNNPMLIAGGGGAIRNQGDGAHIDNTSWQNAHGQGGSNAGVPRAPSGDGKQKGYSGHETKGVGHGAWIGPNRYACAGGGAGWLDEGSDAAHASCTGLIFGSSHITSGNGAYFKQPSSQTCGGAGAFGRDYRLALGMKQMTQTSPYTLSANSTVVPSTEKLWGGYRSGSTLNVSTSQGDGGFGGGGGGGNGGQGGGGGYTGGGGTYSSQSWGGGGGSYNGGSSQTNSSHSNNQEMGKCIITRL